MILSFAYGFFQSLQFTSMNTLLYPDVNAAAAGSAATIASTAQQLSMSFGVATASLVAGLKPTDGSAVSQHRADLAEVPAAPHA